MTTGFDLLDSGLYEDIEGFTAEHWEVVLNKCLNVAHVDASQYITACASIVADLITEDPVYDYIAGRMHMFSSDIDAGFGVDVKNLPAKFNAYVSYLEANDLGNAEIYPIMREAAVATPYHLPMVKYAGAVMLKDRYFMRHKGNLIENWSIFVFRVGCGIGSDADHAVLLMSVMSNFEWLPGTPTLYNAGRKHSQMSSCYLLDSPEDSINEIYDQYKKIANLSKFAGGVATSWTKVRARGSYINGTGGKSNGIVPWLKILDSSVNSVNQGGLRKGACCVYIEPWHADIEEFLEVKDNTGDEARRTHNINTANWIPDLFMERVKADAEWTLFDPAEVPELHDCFGEAFRMAYESAEIAGMGVKTVRARDLYARMMRTLAETGNGWMTFKDRANENCSQVTEKTLNVVHSSNLCVAPDTRILTSTGWREISELHGQYVEVWNGERFSSTKVVKTGEGVDLVRVTLSNGSVIDCTPYHKFIPAKGDRIEAGRLSPGTKLIKHSVPVIEMQGTFPYAYTHGFFCGDGTYGNNRPKVTLYGDKKDLLNYLDVRSASGVEDSNGRINIQLPLDLPAKFAVPFDDTIATRLEWLAGYIDADGTIAKNGKNVSIQIGSIHKDFLVDVMLMLQTLGVQAKVTKMRGKGRGLLPDGKGGYAYYDQAAMYRLLITSYDTQKLREMGLPTKRCVIPEREVQRDARQFVKVVSVEHLLEVSDTYCFTEPEFNAGMFEGVLAGNCTEILEVTDSDNTAVCNLGSLNAEKFIKADGSLNVNRLIRTVAIVVEAMDNVVDRNFYPTEQARRSNLNWRPIGLGLMGLNDAFYKAKVGFDTPEALELSTTLQKVIYDTAFEISKYLAIARGPFPKHTESRYAEGWSHPNGYLGVEHSSEPVELRNSLLIAIAPTASIATLAGCYPSIDANTSNLYKRSNLSGEFIVINHWLANELKPLGLWTSRIRGAIIEGNGSVQRITEIPESIRARYKTAWEISNKASIDLAAARQPYIDQSQSLNLFVESPTLDTLSSMYMYAWESGLKTTYYLRSRGATDIRKVETKTTFTDEEKLMCSLENPEACEACQ